MRIRIVSLVTAIVLGLSLVPHAVGAVVRTNDERSVSVYVDGRLVPMSPAPIIRNGRTLVPVRAFSQLLGADVEWNSDDQAAVLGRQTASGVPVMVRIWPYASDPARVEVSQSLVNLDYYHASVAPEVLNDRVYLPFRLITDAFDTRVDWDQGAYAIRVDTSRPAEPQDAQEAIETLHPDSNGHMAVGMPSEGFHYSPASIRLLRALTLAGNDILSSYNRNSLQLTVDSAGGRIRYTDINGTPVADQYADHVIVWRNEYQAAVLVSDLKDAATQHKWEAGAATAIIGIVTGGKSITAQLAAKWLLAGAGMWKVVGEFEDITPSRIDRCVTEAKARHDAQVMIGVVYTAFGNGGCINRYVDESVDLAAAARLIKER